MTLWGLNEIKTRGESIAVVLELVGARPVAEGTGRVVRFELLPLDELVPAQSAVDSEVHTLVLRVNQQQAEGDTLAKIGSLIADHKGEQRLHFQVQQDERLVSVQADARFNLRLTDDLLDELAEMLGPQNLAFTRR